MLQCVKPYSGEALMSATKAYARMLKSDVKYRFSIDMASLKA